MTGAVHEPGRPRICITASRGGRTNGCGANGVRSFRRNACVILFACACCAGQLIFRVETLGDEPLSTDKLALHRVVQNSDDPGAALKVGLQVAADVVPTAHKSVAAQLETGPPGGFLHRSNGFVIRLVEFALSIVVRIADVSDQGLRRRLPCERLDRAFFWAGFW